LKVFIENERGSLVKHLHDEKTLERKGTMRVSRPYPYPYGFVLDTNAEDGDNVDCLVITGQSLHTGEIVECEAIGLMEQIEDDEIDHKVLAVLPGEECVLDQETRQTLIEFASHVFDHVPGKRMRIGEFRDRETAIDFVEQHHSRTAA
jgi:inorganic pyrophosphatase